MSKYDMLMRVDDFRLSSTVKDIHDFLSDSSNSFYFTSKRIYVDLADFFDVYVDETVSWNEWLMVNKEALTKRGVNPKFWTVGAAKIVPKCTCGTATLMGMDANVMFHSSWCELKE